MFEKLRKNIRPLVLTDYHRAPYISDYDRNFRVTFDKNLIIKKQIVYLIIKIVLPETV